MNQDHSLDTPVNESDPIQHHSQQTQHVIGQTDTMAQHHNNVPFYPPHQAQMTPFPYTQFPYPQQIYNSPFGGSNMTWASYVNASHSLQSSPVVRITPSVTVTDTSSFPTLHTSQSRAVDTPITTLHDQYGSSSQQRPLYGMCGYPTGVLPPVPLPPPQVESYLQPQQQHFAQYAHPHLPYHMMYQPPQQAHMRPQFLPQYQLQQPQQIFGANISGNNMTSSSTGILQASAPQHLTVDSSESVMRYDFFSQQRPQIQNPQWNHSLLQQQAHHAYQQQMNAYYSMMFQQQALMRALQSQVQLLQQIGFTSTSASPMLSSRSCTPSTSQTIYSVAPQPTTVHIPVTTVLPYSEQHNSPSLSSSQNVPMVTTTTSSTSCSTSVDGDETLHFFEVSFIPKRRDLNNKLTTEEVYEIVRSSEYQLLHRSNTASIFLKVHKDTKKRASDKKIRVPMKLKKVYDTEYLQKLAKDDNIYVDKEMIKMALEPKFIHHGLLTMLRTTDPKLSVEHCIEQSLININYEVPQAKAFLEVIRKSLKDEFTFGNIKLPMEFRKPYSEFGRSLNDLCIVHKTFYKQHGKVAAGVVVANEENTIEVLDKGNDIVFDEMLIKGGVIEFKNNKYAIDQTIKEMLKCAGDLVAKTLIEGNRVDCGVVFGLAINLNSQKCFLIVKYVDFIKEKVTILHSSEAVHVHIGLNWLLNCITLK